MNEGTNDLAIKLDEEIDLVTSKKNIEGFQMAFHVAKGIKKLNEMITEDYMKEIMPLQGTSLGFKTDKVYPVTTVKKCLIEAVLWGVQPWGNQFNIIADNMYITGEGFTYLLKKISGLKYEMIPGIPKLLDKTGEVEMNIKWQLGNAPAEERVILFVVKVNSYMGTDAVIGKAKRKAKCWLFNHINNVEITDADADEIKRDREENMQPHFDWDGLTSLYNQKKGLLTATQVKSSERIITSKEETGYKKLWDFLEELN